MVELVLTEKDDACDLAADCDNPRERRENAEALCGRLLPVGGSPLLGDVDFVGRLLVCHGHIPSFEVRLRAA
jgi:hypothetical protein